jgi:Tol biopolymer transport system component
MRPLFRRSARCCAGLGLLFLGSCLGDFFNPLDQPGLRVVILPTDTTVYLGSQYQARGRMLNSYGDLYTTEHIEFAGADPSASVSDAGAVTGQALGRARVIGRRSDLADTAWVSVVPSGTIALSLLSEQSSVDVINLDGSRFMSIAPAGQFRGGAPAWLPTGDGLVYQESTPGGGGSSVLYVTDMAGIRRLLVPTGPHLRDEKYPRVSRDGSWVYFRNGIGAGEIWRIHPDGSGLELVSPTAPSPSGDTHPDPSPDGTRLAFSSGRFVPGQLVVAVRDLTTGAEQSLGVQGLLPRWSPDGDWIAYWSGDESAREGSIFLVRPSGAEARMISAAGRFYRPEGLDWSPDGEWIVARADTTLELVQVSSGMALPLAYTRNHDWASFKP